MAYGKLVAPRSRTQRENGSAADSPPSRTEVRKVPQTGSGVKIPRQVKAAQVDVNESGFDGVVDNRVIPDAGLPTERVSGVLELTHSGYGYLRPKYLASDNDVYLSASQVRRFGLKPGDWVGGQARQPKPNERYWGLLKVETVNGIEIDQLGVRRAFDELESEYPHEQIQLATENGPMSTRMVDLLAPIGKGQRGLIVSPPKAGKTWLLKDMAEGVAKNYPSDGDKKDGMHLMAVLIGERPEEVTDMRKHVQGEVVASNFDQPPQDQVQIAELALERAKRLAEMGQDVFMLLDSVTRLARAYNLASRGTGRTMSGGFDAGAIFPAKKFLGAARKFTEGGSLTIVGTTLVATGSRMDDMIYEEFKGTGNMELHLDRKLAERRVFPAIDAMRSGTRQEELLYGKEVMERIVVMRRMLGLLGDDERTGLLIDKLQATKFNKDFLENIDKA
jgi:transcription termination factor Rho